MKLEQLQTNTAIRGIVPDALVTVVSVRWFGSEALELTDKTASGKVANELPYRHDDPSRNWSNRVGPGASKAPSSAWFPRPSAFASHICSTRCCRVHASIVEPLPYQITAATKPCCLANRCASPWRTIPASARRSWPAC